MRNFSMKIFAFINLFYLKYMKDRTIMIPIYACLSIVVSLTFLAFVLSFFSVAPSFNLKRLALSQPFYLDTRDSKLNLEFTSLTTSTEIQCLKLEIICTAPAGMEYVTLSYIIKNQGTNFLSFSIENGVLNAIDDEQYTSWFFVDYSEQNLFFKTDEELKGEEIFLLPMDTDILTIQGLFRMTNIPPREFQLIVSSPNINNTEFKVNPRQRSSRNN